MANIILKFGAYEAHGILKYRPERLFVLIGELLSEGLPVEIYPWLHVNRLGIFVAGRLIFTCRISYLSLFEPNQTCSLAISKVLEAVEAVYPESLKKVASKPVKQEMPTGCEAACFVHFAPTHKTIPYRPEQKHEEDTESERRITAAIVAAADEPTKVILLHE